MRVRLLKELELLLVSSNSYAYFAFVPSTETSVTNAGKQRENSDKHWPGLKEFNTRSDSSLYSIFFFLETNFDFSETS